MATKYGKVQDKGGSVGLEALAKSVRKIEARVREIETQVEDSYRLLREIHEALNEENGTNWQDLYENGNDYV